jgi:hypothetical protein
LLKKRGLVPRFFHVSRIFLHTASARNFTACHQIEHHTLAGAKAGQGACRLSCKAGGFCMNYFREGVCIMMQMSEIKQQFQHIEQTINQAAQACRQDDSVSQELKSCIQELDQQSDQAKQVFQSQDEERIRACIDDLEDLGDRAKRACEQSGGNVTDQVKSAVMQAHQELSDLKHQLH